MFELNGLSRKLKKSKNLSFDEAFLDIQEDGRVTLEDERETVDYRLLGSIMFLVLGILFGRLVFLQAMHGDEYRALAEGNKLRTRYVLAPRGLITDSYGKVIAGNIPSFELIVVPKDLFEDPDDVSVKTERLSDLINVPIDDLRGQIASLDPESFQAVTLVENLNKDLALTLLGQADEFKGFAVENVAIRDYKDPFVFAHLIGYTGKINQEELAEREDDNYLLNDYIGKTGLEIQYEKYLRGTAGQKQKEIDAQGSFRKALAEIPARPGNNIKLSIDYDLQKKIYDSMIEVMGRGRARKGAAVATNPKTGQVLALLSFPSFDGNHFARGIKSSEYAQLTNDKNIPLLNRAITGAYPPGSTVKPMLGLAAISEGVVTPHQKVLDDGVIRVGSFTYYGYNRSGLGLMDVYSAIARSSDIYFYTIGGGRAGTGIQGLGPDKLAEWYRKFHLGQVLGIDLPQEKPGLVPDPAWKKQTRKEDWYLGNTYHYAIGQGDLLVTPLQVNSWTATIANNGRIMKPKILDEVTDDKGKVIEKTKTEALAENQFDMEKLKIIQEAMRQTVTAGSAQSLKSLPMAVSGKTGTAQFVNRNLTATHAWFTSYAPSDDPEIALTILVEEGGEGSSVSVPISKMVYEWWAENRLKK